MSLKQPSRELEVTMVELCDEFGIRHQFSAKYTPQSNGPVERKNRTLIDMARSMLQCESIFLGQSYQHGLLL